MASSSNPPSIFENGMVKPGVYKIQNLYAETYLDIHEHSRELCCRPVSDLDSGKGLVCPCELSTVHIANDEKWKIKRFGSGYVVQRVRADEVTGFLSVAH
jgi:hypothetical protein